MFYTPALREVAIGAGLVNADMENMKGVLNQGTSLCITPGGIREMYNTRHNVMRLVDGRKGFFKLAKQTGLPLVPIFCYGENEMFERPGRDSVMPTTESIIKWFNEPLKKTVRIYIGEPMKIKGESSEKRWKSHIERMYSFTKPAHYADSVEWIVKKRKEKSRK